MHGFSFYSIYSTLLFDPFSIEQYTILVQKTVTGLRIAAKLRGNLFGAIHTKKQDAPALRPYASQYRTPKEKLKHLKSWITDVLSSNEPTLL